MSRPVPRDPEGARTAPPPPADSPAGGTRVQVRLTADDPLPGLEIRSASGAWLALHSRRDPLAEAQRSVRTALASVPHTPGLLIVIGLGLGYLLDVLEHEHAGVRVLAIEPEPALAAVLHQRRSWHHWLSTGRLTLLVGPGYQGAGDVWRLVDPNALEPPLILHPVLAREAAPAVTGARAILQRILFDARANAQARQRNGARYLLNTLANLGVVARSGDVASLETRFAGMPAVIAAAGPSLNRNLDDLRAVRDRALVIAVDTAIRPLVEAGVHPDLVVAVDPSPENARHLCGLPPLRETWLVAEPSVGPEVFPAFGAQIFCFKVAPHEPWPWLKRLGVERGTLRAWGSVVTSACDLALKLGCNPIIYIGADLAFTEDRPYCRGTTWEEDWAQLVARGQTLEAVWAAALAGWSELQVPDVHGSPVRSASHLRAFRDWLVDQSTAFQDRSFINATGAGILHGGGIQQSTLGSVLERAVPPGAFRIRLRSAHGSPEGGSTRIRRAVDALLHSPAVLTSAAEPWREWCAFTGHTVRPEALVHALERASHDLTTRAGVRRCKAGVASSPAPALRRPEQAALLRAALSGPAPGSVAAPADSDAAAAWSHLQSAAAMLSVMLRTGQSLVTGSGPVDQLCHREFGDAPLSFLLPWTADAARHVRCFTTALAQALGSAGSTGSSTTGRFWTEASEPLAAESRTGRITARPEAPAPADVVARLALVLEWLAVREKVEAACATGQAPRPSTETASTTRARRLVCRLGRILTEASGSGPVAGSSLEIRSPDPSVDEFLVSAAVPLAPLLRELTGCLAVRSGSSRMAVRRHPEIELAGSSRQDGLTLRVRVRPPAGAAFSDPRVDLVTNAASWIEPIVLTDRGLPRCCVAAAFGEGLTLVTAYQGTLSYRVEENGACTPGVPWTRAICGELPLNDLGGAMAWNNGPSPFVLTRSAPGGVEHVEPLPCRPSFAWWQPDGSVLMTSFTGGLWHWRPGEGTHCLIATPPVIGLRRIGDRWRLDPVEKGPAGETPRVLLPSAWTWRPGDAALTPLPLGPEGQCWSVTALNGWTAEGYPNADLVRLTHASGFVADLACYYPCSLAWTGRSLVVATTHGEVLLFERLTDVLNGLKDAAPRS